MSAERFVDLIEQLASEYQLDSIFLLDDNFFVDVKRVEKICQLLLDRGVKIHFQNANCRADTIEQADMKFLSLVRRAGFESIFIGVESGSPRILEQIQKDITVEQAIRADQKLKDADIHPIYGFMVGFPGETIEDVKQTIHLMNHLIQEYPDALIGNVTLFHSYPGTLLHKVALKKGMKIPDRLEDWINILEYDCNLLGHSRKFRNFVYDASIFTNFIDCKWLKVKACKIQYRLPIFKTLESLYGKYIRFRLKHDFYSFMPEMVLLRMISKQVARTLLSKS